MIDKLKTFYPRVWMIGFFLLLFTVTVVKVEVGFAVTVKPALPKNQHNPEATYYDLRMVPNQEQDLTLELVNDSDSEQKVTIQINDATTNDAGEIDYSDRSKDIPRDKSLKYSLKDIATAESEIIVPAKKTITTTVHVTMPGDEFNGMVLGGIKVTSSEKNKQTSHSESIEKSKEQTYIVAVKLTETDAPVSAELELLKLLPVQDTKEKGIKAIIQNKQAVNLEDIEYTARIYKKNSDKVLHQTKVTGYRMAPNSSFSLVIAEEKQELQAGEYQAHVTAKSKATNQEWKWTKEFEISQTSEEKEKKASKIGSDRERLLFYTIIFVVTFVFLLILLLILLILRKRKEKQFEEAMEYRKKKRERNNRNSPKIRKPKREKNDTIKKKRPSSPRRSRR
ncbi:DUF916 and DUF3324 domain-containing protein [Candidatus Enterococcus ikei]|uniref:DUF916 and DUF3324 domain-containing protein n=1 Tax=Candidatus Enterococcus ikei TaxID=2815326 RepID=A0ABS3H2Q3_9ENTE|nr:DUF916 and DUF3324 domain-containing protein [Enterococcus sp. DIV0869a]MBO0441807.1 DUF916 and DUF3324 domain-containing protein [Enterococcus sp. DIV0869a]